MYASTNDTVEEMPGMKSAFPVAKLL